MRANLEGVMLCEANLQQAMLREANLNKAVLRKTNLAGADLSKAHLEGANLEQAMVHATNFWTANLAGADFKEADLSWAEFSFANLTKAQFEHTNLQESKFLKATLVGAVFENANLKGALLASANLEEAIFKNGDLRGARLEFVNLKGAKLISVRLEEAWMSGANLENTLVADLRYDRRGKSRGIRISNCYGSPRFRAFAMHQDFIEELREGKWWEKILVALWNVFADCGRTPWLWIGWSVLFAVYFGIVYFWMGPEAFKVADLPQDNLLTYIYYSVVTFTTLGFGDVTPKTLPAAAFVMAEVILGYVMLGGLISIFATLITRRT